MLAALPSRGRHRLRGVTTVLRETPAASVVAPLADDERHTATSDRLLRIMFAILGGFDLSSEKAIDAIRSFRAITHGFVSLELAGSFGLPQSVDASFERLVDTFIRGLAFWHEPG